VGRPHLTIANVIVVEVKASSRRTEVESVIKEVEVDIGGTDAMRGRLGAGQGSKGGDYLLVCLLTLASSVG